MGRRSVWSDPRLIEAAQPFVPVADEVWRLQTGEDRECRTFQAMANAGHYRHAGGTRQGIYVCAPSGRLLASINSNDPGRVLEMIARGRDAWDELDESERWLEDPRSVRPAGRHEDHFPEDGLVLESTNRDLSEGPGTKRWNRDYAWFSSEEARRFLPPEPTLHAEFTAPRDLMMRLARFHLVDDVRGQTIPFAPQEVERAELLGRVTAIEGSLVHVEWTGSTHSDAAGPWLMGENLFKPPGEQQHPHGLAATLRGSAVFDLDAGRFTEFEVVALAERWGRTQFNGRWRDAEDDGRIGFVLRLAPESERRIPPAFADVYDAAWMRGGSAGEARDS